MTFIGITDFSKHAVKQKQPDWCWAATFEMICSFHHINLTQEDFVRNLYDGALPNNGAGWKQIDKFFQNLNSRISEFRITAKMCGPGLCEEKTMVDHLRSNQLIFLHYNNSKSGGHAVLITGCHLSKDEKITSVTLWDPADGKCVRIPNDKFSIWLQKTYWLVKPSHKLRSDSNSSSD